MCYHASPFCVGAATATPGERNMQSASDRATAPKTAMHPQRRLPVGSRNTAGSRTAPHSHRTDSQISNRNKTAFKISRNSNKTQFIAISNRNITPAVAVRKSAVAINLSSRSRDLTVHSFYALSWTNRQISNRQFARLETLRIIYLTKARLSHIFLSWTQHSLSLGLTRRCDNP
jgi:hypothetical protein